MCVCVRVRVRVRVCVCVSACTVNVAISLKESFKFRLQKKNLYYFSSRKKPMHLRSRKFSLAFKDSHFPSLSMINFHLELSKQTKLEKNCKYSSNFPVRRLVVRQNDLIHQIGLNS